MTHEWRHGQKAELARRVGISPSYLNDILAGRKRAQPDTAKRIHQMAFDMSIPLSLYELVFPPGAGSDSDTPKVDERSDTAS